MDRRDPMYGPAVCRKRKTSKQRRWGLRRCIYRLGGHGLALYAFFRPTDIARGCSRTMLWRGALGARLRSLGVRLAFVFCASAWRRTSSKIAAPFPIKPVAMLEALKRLNGGTIHLPTRDSPGAALRAAQSGGLRCLTSLAPSASTIPARRRRQLTARMRIEA